MAAQETTNTPTLDGGDSGGVWILLLSEVTLFEYSVSTILTPIVGWYSMRIYWLGEKQVSVVRINGMPVY